MVALLTSLVITVAMTAGIIVYGLRRPLGTRTTWGEAMIGATYVFMLLIMVFGVLPDRFVRWTDNELEWSNETFLFTEGQFVDGDPITFPPFRMDMKKVSDTVVVIEHLVALGLLPLVWLWWQKRGQGAPADDASTSDFGRPLVKGS